MVRHDDTCCIWSAVEFASKPFELLSRDKTLLVEPGPYRREPDHAKPVRVMCGFELIPHIGERVKRTGEAPGRKRRNVVVARYCDDGNAK